MKYSTTPNTTVVVNVIGIPTKVRARASTNGWYKAAFLCLRTIERCVNKAGISAMVFSAVNSKALSYRQHRFYK